MKHYMTRGAAICIMVVTVILAGIAGFGGTYLAGTLSEEKQADIPQSTAPAASSSAGSGNTASTAPAVANPTASGTEMTIEQVAGQTAESVVEIVTETVQYGHMMGQYVSSGAGSGVIISADGYILTNNHVTEGATSMHVTTRSGETYDAKLVGTDAQTDLAVIKIEASGLVAAQFGDSSALQVGETVVAIGNPLGQLGGSVTSGIISALDRDISIDGEIMKLLQTTAAINPGNSGGGLFNLQGELVGIVNAKSSGTDIEGIGFAIPANTASAVAQDLIASGYVKGRPDMGVTLIDITDERTAMIYRVGALGAYVLEVTDSSSPFQVGDRIVSADGQAISNSTAFKEIIDGHNVGDTLSVTVDRNGVQQELSMTLREQNAQATQGDGTTFEDIWDSLGW